MAGITRFSVLFWMFFGAFACSENRRPSPAALARAYVPPVSEALEKPESPSIDSHLAQFLADYETYFAQKMAQQGPAGGALVIVKDSLIVFCKGFGYRAAGQAEKVDEHTVFRLGSLSKGFAGILTGLLAQENHLDLEDPVTKYYPEFVLRDAGQTRRLRISHLLSHTTGLPYHAFTNMIEQGEDLPTIVRRFRGVRLYGKEGVYYSYQNAAFSAIQEVLRGAAHQDYATLLSEKIFRPAGMTDASATYEAILATENKALPHVPTGAGWVSSDFTPEYYRFAAAGGVNASAQDMGQWLKLLLGHAPQLASVTTLDAVFRPRVSTMLERRIYYGWQGRKQESYALGWRVLERTNGQTLICHSGVVNDFRAEIALDRAAGIGVCILLNGNAGMASECIPTFFERYAAVYQTDTISGHFGH